LLPTSVKVRPLAAASRRSNRTRNHRDINKWHSAARVHSPAMSHKHPHDFGQGETARSRVPSLAAAGRRSNRTRNHRDINKWHSALRRGLTVTTVTRGLRICDPLDTCWWTCVHPFLSEMCREERYCLSVFPLRASVCAARRGTVRLRGYAGFLFGIVECFVRVVVGSLRDHTAHMNSLVFQTALSSCLTAV